MSDGVRSSLVAAGCLLRGLPLFFRAAPKTPLRVLGIIALDTLHVLRRSRPLPRQRIRDLATFLDLEGCANQQWDHKHSCAGEYEALTQRLAHFGLGPRTTDYLSRLRELESARPVPGGDHRRFDEVRSYREAVARLSITTAAAIALDEPRPGDEDVDTLFRILMQCQIIDDVMDCGEDQAAGLPSFLTASASLPQAMELTAAAARHYAASGPPAPDRAIFPLRVALRVVTALARILVCLIRPILNTRQRGAEQTC
jgi:hypothetical protein